MADNLNRSARRTLQLGLAALTTGAGADGTRARKLNARADVALHNVCQHLLGRRECAAAIRAEMRYDRDLRAALCSGAGLAATANSMMGRQVRLACGDDDGGDDDDGTAPVLGCSRGCGTASTAALRELPAYGDSVYPTPARDPWFTIVVVACSLVGVAVVVAGVVALVAATARSSGTGVDSVPRRHIARRPLTNDA